MCTWRQDHGKAYEASYRSREDKEEFPAGAANVFLRLINRAV